jgi:membrane protein YdbS with pleckstrin-like domain
MNILLECPYCSQQFERDESLCGTAVQCPGCKHEIKIPVRAQRTDIKEARLVNVPQPSQSSSAVTDKEETILEFRPVFRAFLDEIIVAIGLLAGGVALAQFVHQAFLALVAVAVIILVDVWIKFASRKYRITNQRLFVTTGLLARKTEEIELFRVKDIKVDQGILQRLLGYGAVTVFSSDETSPQLVLIAVGDPMTVKETLRTLYRAARK